MDSIEIYEEGQYPDEFGLDLDLAGLEHIDDAHVAQYVDELANAYLDEDVDLLGDETMFADDYLMDQDEFLEDEIEEDEEDDEGVIQEVLVESDLESNLEVDAPLADEDDPVLKMLSIIDDIADLECQLETSQRSDDYLSEHETENREIVEELLAEKNEKLMTMEQALSEDDLEIWLDVVADKPLRVGMLKSKPALKLKIAQDIQDVREENDEMDILAHKEFHRRFMEDEVAKVSEELRIATELLEQEEIGQRELRAYGKASLKRLKAARAANRAAMRGNRPVTAPSRAADIHRMQRRASANRVNLMVQARNQAASRCRQASVAAAAKRPATAAPKKAKRAPLVIPARIDPVAENRRRIRRLVVARNNYANSTQAYTGETVPATQVSKADKRAAVLSKIAKINRIAGVQAARKTAADKKTRLVHADVVVPKSKVLEAEKKAVAIVEQAEVARKFLRHTARKVAASKEQRNKHVDAPTPVANKMVAMQQEKAKEEKKQKTEKVEKIKAARNIDASKFSEAAPVVSPRIKKARKAVAAREIARTNRVATMVAARKEEKKEFVNATAPKSAVATTDKAAAKANKKKEKRQVEILTQARKAWASKENRSAYAKNEAVTSPRILAMKEEEESAKKDAQEKMAKKVAARKVDVQKFAKAKAPTHAKAEAEMSKKKEKQHGLAKVVEKLKASKKEYSKSKYIPKDNQPKVTALKPGAVADVNTGQASFSTLWALKRMAEKDNEILKTRKAAEMVAQAANKFSLPERRQSELTRQERVAILNNNFAAENKRRQNELQAQLDWLKHGIVDGSIEDSELDEFAQFENEQRFMAGEPYVDF